MLFWNEAASRTASEPLTEELLIDTWIQLHWEQHLETHRHTEPVLMRAGVNGPVVGYLLRCVAGLPEDPKAPKPV